MISLIVILTLFLLVEKLLLIIELGSNSLESKKQFLFYLFVPFAYVSSGCYSALKGLVESFRSLK